MNCKCSYDRWLSKKVYDKRIIFSPSKQSIKDVIPPKNGILEYSDESFDNKGHSLVIKTSNDVENASQALSCGISINVSVDDAYLFNRVSTYIYFKSTGFNNLYFHFSVSDDLTHTESIEANVWKKVMWESEELKKVNRITITPFLFGTPPEGLSEIEIYIGDVVLEKVDLDYVDGWDLEDRIAYSHVGYFNGFDKTAIVSSDTDDEFSLVDINGYKIYKCITKTLNSNLGKYQVIDFSDFNIEGKYKIVSKNKESGYFEISNNPYQSSILKSINFLHSLRCGEEVEGVHSACHLNCKTIHENKNTVPNFGGWHDAGDLSQFEIPTAEMANALIDLANVIDDEETKKLLIEEAKVGIRWLLQTRFSDGSRALAVSYSIWRNNELKDGNQSVFKSVAEKGPFESFCSASALASATTIYKDKNISDWCLRVAKEDYEYAKAWYKEGIHSKRWGSNIDSQVCGHGLLACSVLYKVTNDVNYLNDADTFVDIILKCQERDYIFEGFKIRGFFYEDINHKYLLTYEHRGHEQSPIQGLCKLLEVDPLNKNKDRIIETLNLYKEYILETINVTSPYGLIPAHVYIIDKINLERFTIPSSVCTKEEGHIRLIEEIKNGIKLSSNAYLRIFPIAVQRKGFHATLLSKTKAVSLISKALDDHDLMIKCVNQLEWILGKNPFSTSTMYGEGYNYHPLYVAFSNQIIGALPVGFKTNKMYDRPYWPVVNNAVFKEIWGHTTGKYLWVLADVLEYRKMDL